MQSNITAPCFVAARHRGICATGIWSRQSKIWLPISMEAANRERLCNEAVLIGFSTYHGTVTASSDWGAPTERKNVRPALRGSYEELFHETGLPRFWIDLRGAGQIGVLQQRRIERAIGVIYRPETERLSHYFHARLPEQFDAVIHIDETRAVEPLERTGIWEEGELPETYPFKV